MPDTGHFHILAIEAHIDSQHHIINVISITMRCKRCSEVDRRTQEQLKQPPGGTILTCGKCDAHQAVSNARLVEYRQVLAEGGAAYSNPTALPGSGANTYFPTLDAAWASRYDRGMLFTEVYHRGMDI